MNLKTAGIWTLLALYVMVTSGFTLHAHYCGGNLVDLQLFIEPESCCSAASTCSKDGSPCCDDKSQLVQFEEWQIYHQLQPLNDLVALEFCTILPPFEGDQLIGDLPCSLLCNYDLPPPGGPPLYVLYHSLTYYG